MGHSGQELLTRVANAVYSAARGQQLQIPGFPDFGPVLSALKRGPSQEAAKNYRVTCQQGASLLVLEVHAKKWVNCEHTKDKAMELLDDHNATFNATDTFWVPEK